MNTALLLLGALLMPGCKQKAAEAVVLPPASPMVAAYASLLASRANSDFSGRGGIDSPVHARAEGGIVVLSFSDRGEALPRRPAASAEDYEKLAATIQSSSTDTYCKSPDVRDFVSKGGAIRIEVDMANGSVVPLGTVSRCA